MKKYKGVVAFLNPDQPDKQGDILTDNVEFKEYVTVNHNFDEHAYLGTAKLYKDGNKLVGEFQLDLKPSIAALLKPCVDGRIKKRDGAKIMEWEVRSIGLAVQNADPNIPCLELIKEET